DAAPDCRRTKESSIFEHRSAFVRKRRCSAEWAAFAGGGSSSQSGRGYAVKAPGRAGPTLQPDRQTGAAEGLLQCVIGAASAGDHVALRFLIAARTRMASAGNRHHPVDKRRSIRTRKPR